MTMRSKMRSIRRVGGLAAAGILLTAAATGSSAGAQTAASYTGTATGYALKLALGPQNLTAGSSAAKAASDGTGAATGAGVLSPAQASTIATAANPPGETKPEVCGDSALNAVETALRDIVKLGLGCGSASATGTGTESVATATGKVAALDVNVAPITSLVPVTPNLVAGVDQLTTTVAGICNALPAATPLPTVCTSVNSTVDAVVDSITATSLLGAEVGTSTSGVSVSGAAVTTESTASGAIIRIVPTPNLDGVPIGEPLATITVSRANAKVLCDLNSGSATPSFDPAIVRVTLGGPLRTLVPVTVADSISAITIPANPVIAPIVDPKVTYQSGELTVTPGATVTILPGTPVETEIVVGAGTSKVNADGSANATADGVKIHALKNIGTTVAPLAGGLLVNLAHAEAAAACVAAVTAQAPPPPPVDTPRELPRTGGDTPWVPLAAVAGLALAVVTRRVAARS
ncbi:MAG TPA: hypothetical protein VM933_05800 [Acidimicrobiales bacterium]|nr:hypothetical protein [Acidimicrobiales bacterium]